ncbi:YL1-domain-containing protein [Xylariaceae sp. FL0662B]|nr:YL1-domain-containing protein [Xylariaceae sp. FL0662B]
MATEGDEQRMQTDGNLVEANNGDSSSEISDLSDDEFSTPTEWLATGRKRRSTAGNRMKSMIAAEEPDDELELLFAEDDDDAGFTDIGDDGSDVLMDSSSDDEDAQENGDELEGEKELEKQARESRQAARKRKAQEAIPIKFRKKVKIAPTASESSTAREPKPRPKKKSERTSWLPSPADMPTRASKRETTMLSKEQLHQQMIEREVKRLKQVEAMERKAKKMEALKKPPMTQAQRLAEAAIVEKKNAKSLNRWEEAEKQREEERKAKLAALNNRTLDGPVATFWSGVGEWVDGKLKHVGKIVTIEEKPMKKKRASAVGNDASAEPSKEKSGPEEPSQNTSSADKADSKPSISSSTKEQDDKAQEPRQDEVKNKTLATATPSLSKEVEDKKSLPLVDTTTAPVEPTHAAVTETSVAVPESTPQKTEPSPSTTNPGQSSSQLQEPKPPEPKPQAVKPPDMRPPVTNSYTTSMFAPPQQSQLMKPPELKPPSNSFLAPPAGVSKSGLSMPMIGYHSTPTPSRPFNVLAPPNTTQVQSPLAIPQKETCPPAPTPPVPAQPPTKPAEIPASTPLPTPIQTPRSAPASTPSQLSTPTPTRPTPANARSTPKTPLGTLKPSKANAQRQQAKETPPPPPPPPPANGKATRNCIILQNFNENAVKEKAVQNRILFGKDMAKLGKPAPTPRCAITNHPARYRDPKTGLLYYNSYAFREIQKLQRGEYRWSHMVGAWIGSGSFAARGVPARFLDPNAPGPPKKVEAPENSTDAAKSEPDKVESPTAPDGASAPSTTTPAALEAPAPSSVPGTAPAVTSAPNPTIDQVSAPASTPASASAPAPAPAPVPAPGPGLLSGAPSTTSPPTTAAATPAIGGGTGTAIAH